MNQPIEQLLDELNAADKHLQRVMRGESLNPLVARDWLILFAAELRQRIEQEKQSDVEAALAELREMFPDNCIELSVDAGGWWLLTRTTRSGYSATIAEGDSIETMMTEFRKWKEESNGQRSKVS